MSVIDTAASGLINELVPPHSAEAEKAVLGSMLIEKEAIETVVNMLKEEDFHASAHRVIFREILKAYDRNRGDVDILIVSDAVKLEPAVAAVGGSSYLAEIVDATVTAAHAEHYAKIVKDKSILRDLISAGRKIISHATTDQHDDVNEVVDAAEQLVFSISEKRTSKNLVWAGGLSKPTLSEIERLNRNKDKNTFQGVMTDYTDLDNIIGGFRGSSLNIIAGRPGTGKTSFCLNIAENAAINHKKSILVFSLEMSTDELFLRLLCSQARVSSEQVRRGYIPTGGWPRLTTAGGLLSETKIFIDDSPSPSVLEMKAKARRLEAEKGLDLVIIDYLQLMHGRTGRSEYRQQDIAEISRSLKIMAKDLKIPVIALSQLSREPEKRTGSHAGRPKLADLRESGAIEQDADLVLLIYCPEMYSTSENSIGKESTVSKTEIIVAKNRHGRIGTVELMFRKEFTRFESSARHE